MENFEFNENAFFESLTTTEAGSTARVLVPVGEWKATIVEFDGDHPVKFQHGIAEQGKNAGKVWMSMAVKLEFTDPAIAETTLRDTSILTYRMFLRATPDSTFSSPKMDTRPGQNLEYNRLREATGNNVAGQEFHPRMFVGKSVVVKIAHEANWKTGEQEEVVRGVRAPD